MRPRYPPLPARSKLTRIPRQPGDPKPKAHPVSQSPDTNEGPGGFGVGMYAALLIGGGAAYFAYQYAVEAGLV